MGSLKAWLVAFRLRTLPLAISSIAMGSFLAAYYQSFQWPVLLLSVLTTIFLQILSNLANDYGDSQHGADSADREGPSRAVQSGAISARAMYGAMTLFSVLSFLSGISLLYISIQSWTSFIVFLALGLLAIGAAITYTAGKRPYGYMGLGDISVFIFFGLLGVLGTFYLHSQTLEWSLLLPATSCGLFATAVLNINNIRDIESDLKAGKYSIPVRIGRKKAVLYHYFLLILGFGSAVIFTWLHFSSPWQWLFLLMLPLLYLNAQAVRQKSKAQELDPYLKQMALSTLFFVLSFGLGLLL